MTIATNLRQKALIYYFAYVKRIPRVLDVREEGNCYYVRYEEPAFSGKYYINAIRVTKEIETAIKPLIQDLEFRAKGMEFPTNDSSLVAKSVSNEHSSS